MDIEKYKSNPKTAYMAKTYLELQDEESKQLILSEMDRILLAVPESSDETFPNEVILEVRAGAGGEEAALFAQELAEMYTLYAGFQKWGVSPPYTS